MVTPALRGHGGSAWPNAGYTLEDHRDDLIAFIDASCEGPVILCGQATGATLALMIATQLGSQRVRAVIAAQPAVAIPSAINDLVQTQVIAQERLASRSAARAALPFASLWSEAVTEHYLEHMLLETAEGGFRWRYHAEGVRATEAQLLRPLDREIAWSGPTLIIGSTESTVLSPESIRALASRLPDARLEWLPRSNHRLCQDNPEGFARLLDDYLSLQLA
jgi:pimeloyl-ACP methyl ester carboxylesterase